MENEQTTPGYKYIITDDEMGMLDKNFVYHPPKEDQAARYQTLRDQARVLAETILRNVPPSRERSVALTSLEQAMFWSNAAIARNE